MRAPGTWIKLSIYALVFCFALSGDLAAFADSDFDKARQLQDLGNYSEAERLYRAVLAVDPDSVPALTNLGVVLSRQGKHSDAIAAYQRVLRLDPALAEVKLNLALAYYHSSQWDKAVGQLRSVLLKSPADLRALQLMAVCLLELERFEDAARAYEKLLPSDDVSILVGAATAYLKTGRREEGEALLARVLSERGGSAEVHFMVGQAQLSLHEYAAAEQSFRRMLDLAPGQREGRFYLGGAYLKQGKEDAALAEWRKAAEDEPRYFPADICRRCCSGRSGRVQRGSPVAGQSRGPRSRPCLYALRAGENRVSRAELRRSGERTSRSDQACS